MEKTIKSTTSDVERSNAEIRGKQQLSYARQIITYNAYIHRFEPAEPKVFRVGDIMELQVTFVVTPMKEGMHTMRAILRSIALIEGKFSEVSTTTLQIDMHNMINDCCRRHRGSR